MFVSPGEYIEISLRNPDDGLGSRTLFYKTIPGNQEECCLGFKLRGLVLRKAGKGFIFLVVYSDGFEKLKLKQQVKILYSDLKLANLKAEKVWFPSP